MSCLGRLDESQATIDGDKALEWVDWLSKWYDRAVVVAWFLAVLFVVSILSMLAGWVL